MNATTRPDEILLITQDEKVAQVFSEVAVQGVFKIHHVKSTNLDHDALQQEMSRYCALFIECPVLGWRKETQLKQLRLATDSAIPIVPLVGITDESQATRLLRYGFSHYLVKTYVTRDMIIDTLYAALKARKSQGDFTYNTLAIATNFPLSKFSANRDFQLSGLEDAENQLHQYDALVLDTNKWGKVTKDIINRVKERSAHTAIILIFPNVQPLEESMRQEYRLLGIEVFLPDSALTESCFWQIVGSEIKRSKDQETLDQLHQELRRKTMKLRGAGQFNELVIQSLPDIIFVKDAQYRIVTCNKPFLELYPPNMRGSIIGTTTIEEYDAQDAEAFLRMDKKAFQLGISEVYETLDFPTGEQKTLYTTKKRFYNSEGTPFILGVARDVTEREALIKQLKRTNKDLEDFAYTASHDLKSPLQGILRVADWIEEDCSEALDEQLQEHVGLIKARAERMNLLLKELLTYSRISGQTHEHEHFDLSDCKAHLLDKFSALQSVEVSIEPAGIYLPKTALLIVLDKLLSNSLKHAKSEPLRIDIRCYDTKKFCEIRYSDNGHGIPHKYAERIFKIFQTLASKDKVEGSGMGLAIVRKILEHYGGEIVLAQSGVLSGASFVMRWPNKSKEIHYNPQGEK